MTKKESYAEMMRELRATYLSTLAGRITLAQTLIEKQSWDELRELFHKVKGTGTTYGFPDLTQLCETMEEVCRHSERRRPEQLQAALELLQYLHQTYLQEKAVEMMSQPQAAIIWPGKGSP